MRMTHLARLCGGLGLLLATLTISTASASAATAGVSGVVFESGAPLSGVSVEAGDKTYKTNKDGAFRFRAPTGELVVKLVIGGRAPIALEPVPVVQGQITELIITLDPAGGPPLVKVESSLEEVVEDAEDTPDKDAVLTTLSGRITHVDKGTAVKDAHIYVRGQTTEAQTDAEGDFSLQLPAGTHDITVVHAAYSAKTLKQVEVAPDGSTTLEIKLEPSSIELAAFTVTAPRITGSALAALEERRESSAVSDIIGAEQMSKSGDSNAAAALKRATGVTVVGGRFVYVRGLGERYSSTLLNGATLPSPDPERRVVPLDMFPADLLESVIIQKAYSPDMPAEFGGGVVQLKTRPFPGGLSGSLSIGTGFVVGTTFAQGLMSESGPTDWLGVDGGFRALPEAVATASDAQPLLETDLFSDRGYTAEELEQFGESIAQRWKLTRGAVPPDFGVSGTLGSSFEIGSATAGYLVALTYDNDWQQYRIRRNYFTVGEGGALESAHSYDFEELTNTVTLAGIVNLGVDFSEESNIRFTSFLNRISDSEARIYEGANRDVATDIRVTRIRWIERTLWANQLYGSHLIEPLGNLYVDWRYALSFAFRGEPDRRQVRYDLERAKSEDEEDFWFLSDRPDGNRRVFSDLSDVNHDISVDFELPLVDEDDFGASLKWGLLTVFKEREVDTRRLRYLNKGPLSRDIEVLKLTPEEIFSDAYIGSDGFQLSETTLETDNYTADQQMYGGYLMGDVALGEDWRLVGGLRIEHSAQNVSTFVPFNPDAEQIGADLVTTDVLPALNVTWEFYEDMLLRLGVSRTVSRPDFRELSPATFNDVTGGRQLFGNPELKRALLTHVDLRWEWFVREGELLSVGFFFKDFQDPIEVIVVPSAQLSVTYENAPSAFNVGVELEWRNSLDFISEALADFTFGGNFAWIDSNVSIPEGVSIQTNKERPLQGQSPYVVNLQLAYDLEALGTTATLLYNVSGPRIVEVGALGAPDVYQEPFHQMDLVVGQKLPEGFKLSFKAKNLLDPDTEVTQGPETVEVYKKGRAFSISVSKKF